MGGGTALGVGGELEKIGVDYNRHVAIPPADATAARRQQDAAQAGNA